MRYFKISLVQRFDPHPNSMSWDALGLAVNNDGEIRWATDDGHACGDPQCQETPFEIHDKWEDWIPINFKFFEELSKYEVSEDNCWDVEEFKSLLEKAKLQYESSS